MSGKRSGRMCALVIGCGYLGRALADVLQEEGHECVTADGAEGRGDYHVDLASGDSVRGLASKLQAAGMNPSCVFLCASTSGGTADDYRRVYQDGAGNAVEAFPRSRIVMCSSSSVYGVKDGGWVTEVHSCHPSEARVKSLLEAEQAILSSGGVVARLSAIYGPGRCVLLTRFMDEGKAIGASDRWVNYIHRDDAVGALIFLAGAAQAEGKRFNVSDTSPMQLGEIYKVLSDVLDLPVPEELPRNKSSRRGKSNLRVSCSLLLSLGWEPLYPSFVDGMYNVLEDSSQGPINNQLNDQP